MKLLTTTTTCKDHSESIFCCVFLDYLTINCVDCLVNCHRTYTKVTTHAQKQASDEMMDQPGMLWLWKALLPWLPSMGRTMRYSSATVITTFQLEIDIDRKCYTTTRLGASHACCTSPAAARRTGPTAMASTSPPGWSSNISFERNDYLAWNWMIHNFDFILLMTMMILIWRVIEMMK